MNSDAAFTIGKGHDVCEDYASNFTPDDRCIQVALSDGCSSSPMTDIGARFVVINACFTMSRVSRLDLENVSLLYGMGFSSWLPEETYDATLMMMNVFDNKEVRLVICGDGYIYLKSKGHVVDKIIEIKFPNNHPRYLSYKWNKKREEMYLIEEPTMEITEYLIGNSISFHKHSKENQSLFYKFDVKDYEFICLFSDGVNSFKNLSMTQVISELTKFKSFTGQFVQRRMNAFKKQCTKEGWEHYDDLSMACIYLGE